MRRLNIITVCGCGLGSSLMAKVIIEKVVNDLGVSATITAADAGTAKGYRADLIVTTDTFAQRLGQVSAPLVVVSNFINREELKAKLTPVVERLKQQLG